MLIDSHTHVNFNAFSEDGSEVVDRSLCQDIWMINVGSQLTTSQRAIKIAADYKQGVYASVGLHPLHLNERYVDEVEMPFRTRQEEFKMKVYRELALDPKVVAIGETGVDYFRMPNGVEPNEVIKKQQAVFQEQLSLAKELDKPVTIHCRGTTDDPITAYQDVMAILSGFPEVKGVIHCFSADLSLAEKFLEMGFFISFTGIITFKNAKDLQIMVKEIPLEKILVETDAPYLAPEPVRGKRNEPAFVKFIAEKIAELKGITFEEVAKATTENARKLFKI